MTNPQPQAYMKKDTQEILKVERMNSNRVVVHFSGGPERVTQSELKEEYIRVGTWSEYQASISTPLGCGID